MYTLLPFRFGGIGDRILVVTDVGEFHFLTERQFDDLVHLKLDTQSDLFLDLKSKFFVTDTDIEPVMEILSIKYRTKKAFLRDSVCLHMVVPTIRCNCQCLYCQVSSKAVKRASCKTDMSLATAKRVVDMIHHSPSQHLKIEFQGGEPLLNLEVVKFIVNYSAVKSATTKKHVEYVVCSNMTDLPDGALRFFKRHNVPISSSLDGPRHIHDRHRLSLNGGSSYDAFCANCKKARSILGYDKVSALATVTQISLPFLREVVDEYVAQGFHSIFIRPINPFGRATTGDICLYEPEQFTDRYVKALDNIIEINLAGYYLVEEYAKILLERILTPFCNSFVDLQSPAGAGLQCALYNYDGNVYASDEGRMLAEMGDKTFILGNVNRHTYSELFSSSVVRGLVSETILETQPACRGCVYLPYCGSDPVREYVESGRPCIKKRNSVSCRLVKPVFEHLFHILLNDDDRTDVFWSWVSDRHFNTVRK